MTEELTLSASSLSCICSLEPQGRPSPYSCLHDSFTGHTNSKPSLRCAKCSSSTCQSQAGNEAEPRGQTVFSIACLALAMNETKLVDLKQL